MTAVTMCTTGQVECGDACTDLQRDNDNCGACGHACGAGELCSLGQCATSCGGGTTECTPSNGAAYCTNLGSDNLNCGACGNACPASSACTNSTCICAPPTSAICGGNCVDLQTDSLNCGSCGKTCNGVPCTGGQCVQVLAEKETFVGPSSLVVDPNAVAWTSVDSMAVRWCPPDGSMPPDSLWIAGPNNMIVGAITEGPFGRCWPALAGIVCDGVIRASSPGSSVVGLASNLNIVYWIAGADLIALQNNGVGYWSGPSTIASGLDTATSIAADQSKVYFTQPGRIASCNAGGCGGNPPTTITTGTAPRALATGMSQMLYWIDGNTVYGCSPASCTPQAIGSGQNVFAVAAFANNLSVYYLADQGVWMTAMTAQAPVLLVNDPYLDDRSAISVGVGYVYFTNSHGEVKRASWTPW